ncbi:MAG TPA: hypothetical protein VF008_00505, partial [Niastella sp.]
MRTLNNPYRGKVILLLATVFMCFATHAQLNYTFAASAGTYTANSGATTIINANVDDQLSTVRDIGFTFTYACNTYTQFKASSNGFLSLGAVATDYFSSNELDITGHGPLIAPLWDDLAT